FVFACEAETLIFQLGLRYSVHSRRLRHHLAVAFSFFVASLHCALATTFFSLCLAKFKKFVKNVIRSDH
ncbi:YfcZ/YiiS family protein, partial [Salmonella enterica subsp. enterica serovar Weltevreden]|nr:YfcZ/YiiS family protein [Salmonella enterica subsp. enterica serovar Weltevreden]